MTTAIWLLGTRACPAAHMGTMPKQTKIPEPIRPELIEPLTEILRDRGLNVREWPADEAAAYRDNGGFQEGVTAVQQVKRLAAKRRERLPSVIEKAVLDALSRAKYMSDLSDRSFESILKQQGISLPSAPERPVIDPRVTLIWAQAKNDVIGAGGTIPWHLPEDLAHFRKITAGQPVIMGRRTWESLPEKVRPLPGRTNIVVTSQDGWAADGAVRASSLTDALEAADAAARPGDRIWIIGGGRLYQEAVRVAAFAVITDIDITVEGDTFAPSFRGRGPPSGSEPAQGWSVGEDGTRTDRNLVADLVAGARKPRSFGSGAGPNGGQVDVQCGLRTRSERMTPACRKRTVSRSRAERRSGIPRRPSDSGHMPGRPLPFACPPGRSSVGSRLPEDS
jgi:dihydrofolate reductase